MIKRMIMKKTNNLLILIGVLFLLITSFGIKDQPLDEFIKNIETDQLRNKSSDM